MPSPIEIREEKFRDLQSIRRKARKERQCSAVIVGSPGKRLFCEERSQEQIPKDSGCILKVLFMKFRKRNLLALVLIIVGCSALWGQAQVPTLVVSGTG